MNTEILNHPSSPSNTNKSQFNVSIHGLDLMTSLKNPKRCEAMIYDEDIYQMRKISIRSDILEQHGQDSVCLSRSIRPIIISLGFEINRN